MTENLEGQYGKADDDITPDDPLVVLQDTYVKPGESSSLRGFGPDFGAEPSKAQRQGRLADWGHPQGFEGPFSRNMLFCVPSSSGWAASCSDTVRKHAQSTWCALC